MAVAYSICHFPSSPWPAISGGDAAVLFCLVFNPSLSAIPPAFLFCEAQQRVLWLSAISRYSRESRSTPSGETMRQTSLGGVRWNGAIDKKTAA